MAGLKLYPSNRLEALLDALASVVKEPLSSPLESEVIVVQSKGMER
ncbi:MAG: exodeoxyribonuclease V subunit gamma, partial [Syntrophorhabdus sp.]